MNNLKGNFFVTVKFLSYNENFSTRESAPRKTLNVDSFFMNSSRVLFPLFYAQEWSSGKQEEGKLSHLFIHLPELLSIAVILFYYLKRLSPSFLHAGEYK
jgi:hypothetical protein